MYGFLCVPNLYARLQWVELGEIYNKKGKNKTEIIVLKKRDMKQTILSKRYKVKIMNNQ